MRLHALPWSSGQFPINRLRIIAILIWNLLAIFTTIWEYNDNKQFLTSNALFTARTGIEKDLIFRQHGEVHVPITELERSMRQSNINHISIIAVTWLMGLCGIVVGFRTIETATAALTIERDNLNSVFNATPMPMLLFDDRMEAVRVNSAFRDYCPDFDKLPDKRCGTIMKCANSGSESYQCGSSPVCDSCHVVGALREVLRSGLPARGEASVPRIEGNNNKTEVTLLYCMELVCLNGQRHALLSFMDITERTRIEEKLATSEREFRALVENSPDAIARYDRLCRRVYVNPALVRLAGQSADHLTGRTPTETPAIGPEESLKIQTAVGQVLSQGNLMEIELTVKDSSGTTRYSHIRFVPEFDANGEVANVLGITQDITSLRKTETQLLHAQKMESIGTLAGGVAHDFNNLLTVIGGYATLLQLSLKEDEMIAYAQEISDTVERGAELTRSLLTFSGKHEPQKQHNDLNQIVVNLRKSMSRLLRSDITLSFELCDDRLPVFVDRGQIEQVLINLLVNARDALTSDGRINITTSLTEVLEEVRRDGTTISPGSYGHVTITDNGIGMDDDTIKKIFEPFFTTKEAGKGTGLGLAIVFGIIRNHNGCIVINSAPEKGSTFEIYLPLFKGHVPLLHPLPELEIERQRNNETVLVVDDDPATLKVTREILDSYGFTVLTAVDGIEALQVFEAHRDTIRVAVIDLIMPRMNGRAAIEEMRQQKPDLPIILTSGYTDDIIDSTVIAALRVVFLPKPIRPQKLVETICTSLLDLNLLFSDVEQQELEGI